MLLKVQKLVTYMSWEKNAVAQTIFTVITMLLLKAETQICAM